MVEFLRRRGSFRYAWLAKAKLAQRAPASVASQLRRGSLRDTVGLPSRSAAGAKAGLPIEAKKKPQ
jgi:hypothetical protein